MKDLRFGKDEKFFIRVLILMTAICIAFILFVIIRDVIR